MEANAGKSFQMQIIFHIFPRISLHCKLVPVQYWEYEYGLLSLIFDCARLTHSAWQVDVTLHPLICSGNFIGGGQTTSRKSLNNSNWAFMKTPFRTRVQISQVCIYFFRTCSQYSITPYYDFSYLRNYGPILPRYCYLVLFHLYLL